MVSSHLCLYHPEVSEGLEPLDYTIVSINIVSYVCVTNKTRFFVNSKLIFKRCYILPIINAGRIHRKYTRYRGRTAEKAQGKSEWRVQILEGEDAKKFMEII